MEDSGPSSSEATGMKASGGQCDAGGREEDQRGQGQVRYWSEEAQILEILLLQAVLPRVLLWVCLPGTA